MYNEAYKETVRKYPDSVSALTFFMSASGLRGIEPTKEALDWSERVSHRAAVEAGYASLSGYIEKYS